MNLNAGLEDIGPPGEEISASDHVDPLANGPEDNNLNSDFNVIPEEPSLTAEDFFGDDVEIGEIPELKEDLKVVAVMEARFSDFEYLLQDIQKLRGMTQDFAMEARQIDPEFAKDIPVGFYTSTPSLTRYQVSLEEISGRMWALIAGVVAMVITAIWRTYKFFTGKDKPTHSDVVTQNRAKQEKFQKTAEVVEEALEISREIEHEATAVHATFNNEKPGGEKVEVPFTTIDKMAEEIFKRPSMEHVRKFFDGDDVFAADILFGGPYTKVFFDLAPKLRLIAGDMKLRSDALINLSTHNARVHTIKAEAKDFAEIKLLSKPMQYGTAHGTLTIREMAEALSDAHNDVMKSGQRKPMKYQESLNRLIVLYKDHRLDEAIREQGQALENLDFVRSDMEKLNAYLGDSHDQGSFDMSTHKLQSVKDTHGRQIMQAVLQFRSDVSSYENMLRNCDQYLMRVDYIAKHVLGVSKTIISKAYQDMNVHSRGEKEIPLPWLRIKKRLHEYNDRASDLHKLEYGIWEHRRILKELKGLGKK